MRAPALTEAALLAGAATRWRAWPERYGEDPVIGPVGVQFVLGMESLGQTLLLEQFLLEPQPDLVWLMGEMATEIILRGGGDAALWRLNGRTQDVWFTLPLLEGFLLALARETAAHDGIVESWELEGP